VPTIKAALFVFHFAPEVIDEFESRFTKYAADPIREPDLSVQRMAELEREVGNLADAIAGGLLKSSPALAAKLAAAEHELATLREKAVPRKVTRLFPRLRDHYRIMVANLPNAVKRDPNRARASIRYMTGGNLTVQSDGKMVRFVAKHGQVQAAFARAIGASR
jgi:hypothetical protein